MKSYFLRLAAWLSQGLHCLVLGGSHDMTLSARCYVEHKLLGNERWRLAHETIDGLFRLLLGQRDHCKASFHADEEFAQQVMSLRSRMQSAPVAQRQDA